MRTSTLSQLNRTMVLASLMMGLAACDKSGGGVEIASTQQDFKVELTTQARPIDILWVVDNSGSMASSQQNLASNFNSFIQDFVALGYDFRMAVTTSDSWFEQYNSSPNAFYSSRWRTGNRADLFNPSYAPQGAATNSGVFVMDKNTPALNSVFTTNVRVGTQGNGDERAFASFQRALSNSANNDFRRNNAYLAIIIVSDEDDFSRTDSTFSEDYNSPKLIPVDTFVSFLDTFTNSNSQNRKDNYQVSAITILDQACLNQLNNSSQKVAQRYLTMADITGGSKNSLCASFNAVLNNIKNSVLTAAAVFKLDREPVDGSIVVKVDGASIPTGASTWTYESATRTVRFAPQLAQSLNANSSIQITYDPKTLL
ncbi:MAG: hypothetical protein ACK5Y2_01000 [Bdellovibrionales bacterium]